MPAKDLNILPVAEKVEKRCGRPKKDEPIKVSFKIETRIDPNEEALNEERKKLGRFVLASNDIDLEPEVMLNYYKGQQAVERGFRLRRIASMILRSISRKRKE